jgi:hypothetical protein
MVKVIGELMARKKRQAGKKNKAKKRRYPPRKGKKAKKARKRASRATTELSESEVVLLVHTLGGVKKASPLFQWFGVHNTKGLVDVIGAQRTHQFIKDIGRIDWASNIVREFGGQRTGELLNTVGLKKTRELYVELGGEVENHKANQLTKALGAETMIQVLEETNARELLSLMREIEKHVNPNMAKKWRTSRLLAEEASNVTAELLRELGATKSFELVKSLGVPAFLKLFSVYDGPFLYQQKKVIAKQLKQRRTINEIIDFLAPRKRREPRPRKPKFKV